MFTLRLMYILLCFKCVFSLQKQLCYNDDECLINAVIERVYPRFVAGGYGVDSSDPLHIDAIVADLATLRYGLYNASMIGFKSCEFVKFNNKRLNSYTYFDYGISCPVLTLQARYDLNGIIDSIPVEGRGQCKIVYEKYNISISGKHEKIKDDEGKEHVNILEYKIVSDLKNGRVRDPEYTDLTFNQHDSSPALQACKKTDDECLKSNVNTIFKHSIKGDADLGIKTLDPMHHKEVDGQLVLTVYGVYKINGTLIVMPIEGHGDYKLVCKGYDIQVETDIKINQDKDGIKHMSVKYFKADGDLTVGMTTDLQNLFDGKQPQLAKDVLKFTNENWSPVAKLLQGPVFSANFEKIIKNMNKYFKHVPLNKIIEE
ncbi:hypothetical protein HF086_005190 [Spodoptera exigua]|uniref:Uncharacterized protein n=1 Tax=Spodoptera exigua TaxID=7107 RepID=A0A922MLC1_SPOEX|nr:hypothetical protein HF086_005190 [Spodoptera exigua]